MLTHCKLWDNAGYVFIEKCLNISMLFETSICYIFCYVLHQNMYLLQAHLQHMHGCNKYTQSPI